MYTLFPTAMLMAQASLVASVAAAYAMPALAIGLAQALAQPRT
ncbi:hypothetical protein [Elioraea sp.]|nr:hypothetical protein [Elioraea sp.]